MRQVRWTLGLLAVVFVVSSANADRVPSSKTVQPKSTGSRPDITVPYLTNGNSNLGVAQGVAPKIYSSPDVQDTANPDVKRVYNLPFWGAVMSFGDKSNGAVPRPPGPPFPSK